jgi:hypothetical protein
MGNVNVGKESTEFEQISDNSFEKKNMGNVNVGKESTEFEQISDNSFEKKNIGNVNVGKESTEFEQISDNSFEKKNMGNVNAGKESTVININQDSTVNKEQLARINTDYIKNENISLNREGNFLNVNGNEIKNNSYYQNNINYNEMDAKTSGQHKYSKMNGNVIGHSYKLNDHSEKTNDIKLVNLDNEIANPNENFQV